MKGTDCFPIIKEKLIHLKGAIRYSGYGIHMPDEEMLLQFQEAGEDLLLYAEPRFLLHEVQFQRLTEGILLEESKMLLEGSSIWTYLEDCDHAILCCMTLSASVDGRIDEVQKEDMLKALLLDAFANAAVEQLRKQVEHGIQKEKPNFTIKNMYAFGYGDLSIHHISAALAFLKTEVNIGVTVNESGLLIPLKSICGIIGIRNNQP